MSSEAPPPTVEVVEPSQVMRRPRTPSPTVARHRGRVAGYARSRAADDPEYLSAQADLAAAKLTEYVERVVADAPPLSQAQRETILAAFIGFKTGAAA